MKLAKITNTESAGYDISFIISLPLILLFGYAATSKLADYNKFVLTMQEVPVGIFQNLAPILGWLVPVLEYGIIILLISIKSRMIGLYFSFFLLLIFNIYIAGMLLSGIILPCTCGGFIALLEWKNHIYFNLFFMVLSMIPVIIRHQAKTESTNEYSPRSI